MKTEPKKKTKKFKFPDFNKYGKDDAIIFCDNKRMISLYNQNNEKQAEKLSPTVKTWFHNASLQAGWLACRPLKDVQTLHGVGCILLNPNYMRVEHHHIILPFDRDVVDVASESSDS